jgi:RNA polymerase sigma factor (sigma-70 family)
MIDFMRDESRFRQKKRWEETGRWRWPEFKVTSYQQSPDEVIFEPSCSDSGQGKSDSKSMVKDLLLNTELTNDEWFIIQQYFYDERTLKEIGQVIGGSESTISQKKTKICKKLLTSAERMCMI